MSVAELASRLNPKSNYPEQVRGKVFEAINGHDIAGAIGLANLPNGPDYLMRLKFALQIDYKPKLLASLYIRLSEEIDFEVLAKRVDHTGGLVMRLCEVSIEDFIQSNVCSDCNGEKKAKNKEGQFVGCKKCGKTGIKSGSRQFVFGKFAQKENIKWRTFQRHYWPLVTKNIDILGRWERVILGAIKLIG